MTLNCLWLHSAPLLPQTETQLQCSQLKLNLKRFIIQLYHFHNSSLNKKNLCHWLRKMKVNWFRMWKVVTRWNNNAVSERYGIWLWPCSDTNPSPNTRHWPCPKSGLLTTYFNGILCTNCTMYYLALNCLAKRMQYAKARNVLLLVHWQLPKFLTCNSKLDDQTDFSQLE